MTKPARRLPVTIGAFSALTAAVALVVATPACDAGSAARDCFVNSDCASGQCLSSGRCAPLGGDDVDSTIFPSMDAGSDVAPGGGGETLTGSDVSDDDVPGAETGADQPADGEAVGGGISPAGCNPDGDGVVLRSEAPMGAGLTANFLVTTQVSDFSTTPDCLEEACSWDLLDIDGDTEERLTETLSPDGHWFSDEPAFADATYVTEMGDVNITAGIVDICQQTQLGVFQVTEDALLLLGLVSETEDGDTLLVYDPPLPFLQFPLEQGDGWQVETTASGPFCGSWVDYNIDQTYTVEVDEAGSVKTPFGEFPSVLRVNSLLERHMGLGVLPSVVRTQTFVAECFGAIAAVVSEEGVDDADFDAVSEVRRLTFLP